MVERRSYRSKLQLEEGQNPTLVGYAAVYNSLSDNLGGFVERIKPGAFTGVLAATPDVVLNLDHEGLPLARTTSGTLQLAEDETGLQVRATLDASDPDVQRLIPKLKRGDLSGMSFAFTIAEQRWERSAVPVREILRVASLHDVSVVVTPAYPDTQVALRSLRQWQEVTGGRGLPWETALARIRVARMRF